MLGLWFINIEFMTTLWDRLGDAWTAVECADK